MILKGNYAADVLYPVGSVVRFRDDNVVYMLLHPCKAGTPPTDTLYWTRVNQTLADAVLIVLDALEIADSDAASDLASKTANNLTTTSSGKVLDARQGKALKTLIDGTDEEIEGFHPDAKTFVLASSTASSEKVFSITVDDTGELTVTDITPAAEGSET